MVRCTAPWEGFEIHNNGYIHNCCISHRSIGTLPKKNEDYTMEWFDKIWNGVSVKLVRQKMLENKLEGICPLWCPHLQNNDRTIENLKTGGKTELYNQNREAIIRSIESGNTEIKTKPMYISFVPTMKCNIRCTMCPQNHLDKDGKYLLFNNKILLNLFPYARHITALGGEPLVSKQYRRIVDNFDPKIYMDAKMNLITNGMLLDDQFLKNIPEKFGFIIVSLDGATAETNDEVRSGAGFDKIIANIKKLVELKPKIDMISIQFTISRRNFRELPMIADLAMDLGVNLSLFPIIGNWHKLDIVDEEDIKETVQLLKSLPSRQPNLIIEQLEGAITHFQKKMRKSEAIRDFNNRLA